MHTDEGTQARYRSLVETLEQLGPTLVAYSGGVDSAFLAYAAHQALGERMLAVFILSPLEAQEQVEQARAFARQNGLPYLELPFDALSEADITRNPPERCYYCKRSIMARLRAYAQENSFAHIIEGQNTDDEHAHRPGRKAVLESGVRSPLVECGFSKTDIRRTAQWLGLSVWDVPSAPCLATRVPYGDPLTPDLLQRIEAAERYLKQHGFSYLRLRAHGDLARIEVEEDEIDRVVRQRREIAAQLHTLGFKHVSLDLDGYRQGSFDERKER